MGPKCENLLRQNLQFSLALLNNYSTQCQWLVLIFTSPLDSSVNNTTSHLHFGEKIIVIYFSNAETCVGHAYKLTRGGTEVRLEVLGERTNLS